MVKSAGYSVIAVTTAWMKRYHPKEFLVANMNSLIGAADKIQVQLNEARALGIKVLPPDVNNSKAEFTVEGDAIRVGMKGLKNLGKVGESITDSRHTAWNGIYEFLWDMIDVLDKRSVEALAYSGALDSFGIKRKVLVENSENIADYLQKVRKYNALGVKEDGAVLPEVPEIDEIYMNHIKPELPVFADEFPRDEFFGYELEYCGMYVSGHPLDGLSDFYTKKDIIPISQVLPQKIEVEGGDESEEIAEVQSEYDGRIINILGICASMKPVTTRNGDIMYLIDIEDKDSKIGMVVWPDTVKKMTKADPMIFRKISGKPILVNGKVKTDSFGTKLVAYSMSIVGDDEDNGDLSEVWIEVSTSDANARANEVLSQFEKVDKGGTQVIKWYEIERKKGIFRKAVSAGCYKIDFSKFLKLKSNFRVTPKKERSKLKDGTDEVDGEWTV